MAITVYPRLSELLRERNLSVAELDRQIQRRFGFSVDPKSLYRLTNTEPVQRADLKIAGAAAAVLGVELGDLFHIDAVPIGLGDDEQTLDFSPEESQHLADLFAQQADGRLSDAEQAELEALVTEYGRRLHERRLREIAQQRGISVDQARDDVSAQLNEALAWWRDFEANPQRQRAIVRSAKRRRTKVAE